MLILYILLVAYILAINFYAFLLVKSLSAKEREADIQRQAEPLAEPSENKPPEKFVGKLCVTGLLGGAIAIYVCMFIFKFRRYDLLLMVLMPLLGVLNVYLWVLLFRSGFTLFLFR